MRVPMSKINGLDLQEIADLIVWDLEGDMLNRPTLAQDWQQLDGETIDDIRFYWREIIVERLEKVLTNVEEDERIDSDFYSLTTEIKS